VDGDEGLAGEAERAGLRAAAGEVLAQRDDRHQAEDADEDDRALDDAKSDIADGDALVDAPRDAVENDRGGDVRDREQYFQQRTDGDPGVSARAEDVVGVVENGVVQKNAGIENTNVPMNQRPK